MIQVGKIRKAFRFIDLDFKSIEEMFSTVHEDINLVEEDERYNLFYTLAHHQDGKRTKSSFIKQNVIPFDIDGIDCSRIEEYIEPLGEALNVDPKRCGIIFSGNGIHILVKVKVIKDVSFFKENKKGYQKLCKQINEHLRDCGLPGKADPVVFDAARIFRLPFTKNIKEKNNSQTIKECILFNSTFDVQDLSLASIGKSESSKISSDKSNSKSKELENVDYPKPDKDFIMDQCLFMRWAKNSPKSVKEPAWYAILSITSRFDDNNSTSKSLTDLYSSSAIDEADKEEKIEQATTVSGPRTCEGINDIWGKCSKCPFYNKITSPILLKSEDFVATEDCGFSVQDKKGKIHRAYEDLLKVYNKQFKHVSVGPIRKTYIWNGTNFRATNDYEVRNYALKKFKPIAKGFERQEFLGFVKDSNYADEEFLSSSSNDGYVNLKNGVYDLQQKKLLEHDPKYKFLYCLPYDYDPKAKSPHWDKFMKDISLDREVLVDILHEYIGYIISGSRYKYQKALLLSGSGNNGKSTFINILREIAGEKNGSNITITSLAKDKFIGSSLHCKLVNFSEEEPPECFRETGIFKNVTGDGVLNVQYKFGDAFEMRNRAKIVISYNEVPYLGDTTMGMIRRLMIVPFDFDLEKNLHLIDVDILDKLQKELPGIFNRALEGWYRLKTNRRFTRSKIVDAEVQDMAEGSDIVLQFVNECIDFVDKKVKMIPCNEVYEQYAVYNLEYGTGKNITKNSFGRKMKKLGATVFSTRKQGKSIKYYQGISLKNTFEVTKNTDRF